MRFLASLFAGLLIAATLGYSGEAQADQRRYSKSKKSSRSYKGKSYQGKSYQKGKSYRKSNGKHYGHKGYSSNRHSSKYRHRRPGHKSVVVVTRSPRHRRHFRRGYGYRYGYFSGHCGNRYGHYHSGVYYNSGHSRYGDRQQRSRNYVSDKGFSIGLRGVAGGTEGSFETVAGLGAFARLRHGFLGLEGSVDSTAVLSNDGSVGFSRVPVMGAGLLYLNPRSPIRVYGLLGAGITFLQFGDQTVQTLTAQGGAGLDFDISSRTTLSLDVRALNDLENNEFKNFRLDPPTGIVTGNLGLSIKF